MRGAIYRVTFLFDAEDSDEADRLHAEALARALDIVASLPPCTCPDVAWLAGALYAAATLRMDAAVNGAVLRCPALGPFACEVERMVSWEALLIGIEPVAARMLAVRFRGLAEVCEAIGRGKP